MCVILDFVSVTIKLEDESGDSLQKLSADNIDELADIKEPILVQNLTKIEENGMKIICLGTFNNSKTSVS